MRAALIRTVEVGNELGEGVLWDERTGTVWWTDIEACRLYCYALAEDRLESFETPQRLSAFGFTEIDDLLVAAFEGGFAFFEPRTGNTDWIAKPFDGIPGLRFNDGRVDARGRFWCGTMAEDERADTIARGALYVLDTNLDVSAHLTGIHISNAICWSPDGSKMYFADSPSQRLRVYDFDINAGTLSGERMFCVTGQGAYPDGAVTDSEGYLWNAHWGGRQVVRYAPDGSEDFRLDIPTPHVTCVAFGGPDMNLIFVTSARQGLSETRIAAETQAGHLFIYESEIKGVPAARFGGVRK